MSTVWGCPLHFKEIEEEEDHDEDADDVGAAVAPPAPISDPGKMVLSTYYIDTLFQI